MRKLKLIPAAFAAVFLATPPAAAAQPYTHDDARAQMQRYCAETAQRTDQAGRDWYAMNCTPAAMSRYSRPVASGATAPAVLFGLLAMTIAIFK